MAKAEATHKPWSFKIDAAQLFALPSGGYVVRDPLRSRDYGDMEGERYRCYDMACFTTLDEAVEWLSENMARPALLQPAEKAKG